MDNLVERLCVTQPVEFESGTNTLDEVKERLLDSRFVFINFPETRGGTELGILVDADSTKTDEVDFAEGAGKISLVGTCELNYQKVRCIAEVDLSTKKGQGRLELLS